MNPFSTTPEAAIRIFEGATGARGELLGVNIDTASKSYIFENIDWGSIDHWGSPDDVLVKIHPFGDYEISDAATGEMLTQGFAEDVLAGTILIGCTIRIEGEREFRSFLGLDADVEFKEDHLYAVTQTAMPHKLIGLDAIKVINLRKEGLDLTFEVEAKVMSMRNLVAAARLAYAETWGDQAWIPATPQEALFEICLGSNPNPSPDEIGFAFTEFWESRDQMKDRLEAERMVAENPDLIQEKGNSFSTWLGLVREQSPGLLEGLDWNACRNVYAVCDRHTSTHDVHPQL